jgi:EpsI family protein
MTWRLVTLTGCFLATSAYAVYAMRPEIVPLREPLATLTTHIGRWQGQEAPKFDEKVIAILGVEDLLNRLYVAPSEPAISLYIGYYQSQREGDTMHSPMNCLPGAGWQPVSASHVAVNVPGRASPIVVNNILIRKGADRQVVLYWYQSHGRVVASEYLSKAYLVYDAARSHRSDAAMIRVMSPVLSSEGGAANAEQRVIEFVRDLFPYLERHLPS